MVSNLSVKYEKGTEAHCDDRILHQKHSNTEAYAKLKHGLLVNDERTAILTLSIFFSAPDKNAWNHTYL